MRHPALSVLTMSLLCACGKGAKDTGGQDTVEFTLDDVDCMADLQMAGDRDHLMNTVTPRDATVAGLPFQELYLDLSLGQMPDMDDDTDFRHGQVEGEIFDGSFTIDGVEYLLDPAPVAGGLILGPAPFHRADDPVAIPVGEAEGDLNFYRLDPDGFDFSYSLRFTFTSEGEPDQDVEHALRVDYMVAEFASL